MKKTKTKRRGGGGKSKRVKTLTKDKKMHGGIGWYSQTDDTFMDGTETIGYKLYQITDYLDSTKKDVDDVTIYITFSSLINYTMRSSSLQDPIFNFLKHFVDESDHLKLKQFIDTSIVYTSDVKKFNADFATSNNRMTEKNSDITTIKIYDRKGNVRTCKSVFTDKQDFFKRYETVVLQAAKDEIGAHHWDPPRK